jgi:hypothetical protein
MNKKFEILFIIKQSKKLNDSLNEKYFIKFFR